MIPEPVDESNRRTQSRRRVISGRSVPGRENEIIAIQLSSHERGSRDLPKFSESAAEEAGRHERFPAERASSFGLNEKQSRASESRPENSFAGDPYAATWLFRGTGLPGGWNNSCGPIGFTVIGINRLFDLLGVMRRIVSPVRGISGKTAGWPDRKNSWETESRPTSAELSSVPVDG